MSVKQLLERTCAIISSVVIRNEAVFTLSDLTEASISGYTSKQRVNFTKRANYRFVGRRICSLLISRGLYEAFSDVTNASANMLHSSQALSGNPDDRRKHAGGKICQKGKDTRFHAPE